MERWQYERGGPLTEFKIDVQSTTELAKLYMDAHEKAIRTRDPSTIKSDYERALENALRGQNRSQSSVSAFADSDDYYNRALCRSCRMLLQQCAELNTEPNDPSPLIPLGLTTELYESIVHKDCALCSLFLSTLTNDDKIRMRAHKAEKRSTDEGRAAYRTVCLYYVQDDIKHLVIYHSLPQATIFKYVALMTPEG